MLACRTVFVKTPGTFVSHSQLTHSLRPRSSWLLEGGLFRVTQALFVSFHFLIYDIIDQQYIHWMMYNIVCSHTHATSYGDQTQPLVAWRLASNQPYQAVSSARRRLSFNIIIDIATINNHTLDWEGFADDTSCSITASGLITGVVELVPNLLTNTYWKN